MPESGDLQDYNNLYGSGTGNTGGSTGSTTKPPETPDPIPTSDSNTFNPTGTSTLTRDENGNLITTNTYNNSGGGTSTSSGGGTNNGDLPSIWVTGQSAPTYDDWLQNELLANRGNYNSHWDDPQFQEEYQRQLALFNETPVQTNNLSYNDWLAEQQDWLNDPSKSQDRYDQYAQSQRELGLIPDSYENWYTTQQDIYNNDASATEAYAKYRGTLSGAQNVNQIVPGEAQDGQVNIADYTGQVATNPSLGITPEQQLSNDVPTITQAEIDAGQVNQQPGMSPNDFAAGTAQVGNVAQAGGVQNQGAFGYVANQTQGAVENAQMTGAQGTVSNEANIDAPQIDVAATAAGSNAVGQALLNFASLDPNDVDARATVLGQIDALQAQFVDANGNATIPPWASGIARNVSKIAAFNGITGTAATSAMAQALLESSIEIARQDASFFQTLTLTNLNNEQQSTIQRASVLANMDMANLDARTSTAIQNSKNFIQMDLQNLDNEQQARLINTQARVQSILEDSKAENASRLFLAQSQNEMDMFYDNLGAQIDQYNASQYNAMQQFNAGEANSMNKFNSEMADSRDKFYREMSYNIDIANAKWRQEVTLTNTQMDFEAAAFDAKNLVNISQEALNQLWDRSDALLDYIWKSGENELDRNSALAVAKLQADASLSIADAQEAAGSKAGLGNVIGNIAGALLGNLF